MRRMGQAEGRNCMGGNERNFPENASVRCLRKEVPSPPCVLWVGYMTSFETKFVTQKGGGGGLIPDGGEGGRCMVGPPLT